MLMKMFLLFYIACIAQKPSKIDMFNKLYTTLLGGFRYFMYKDSFSFHISYQS